MREPLYVQDQVFQLVEGWFLVHRNRVHGTFADRGAAEAELARLTSCLTLDEVRQRQADISDATERGRKPWARG